MKYLLLPTCVLSALPLIAAPVPKRPPPSETAIVIADSLEKPTWKLHAAVRWRVSLDQPGGVVIESCDFSGSIAAMPREEIKNRVKFPKIEPGATAWFDVPGEHFVLVETVTPLKQTWQETGKLKIDGEVVRSGYHNVSARISEWGHPKKRFEFFIREVDDAGRIADANLSIFNNGTILSTAGTIEFTFACPDGEAIYSKGVFWLGASDVQMPLRKHSNWEVKGKLDCSKWLTVEYSISNRQ